MKRLIFLLFLLPMAAFAGDVIRIGIITNATGENSNDTIDSRNGISLAVEEINSAGGILGRKIELITYDNEGTTVGSKVAATKAVKDRVVAVLGCHYSSYALAAAPVLQENKIITIIDDATNPEVTLAGRYIFRVCFSDEMQGAMLAKLAFKKLRLKSMVAIVDVNSKYSIDLTRIFITRYTERGGALKRSYKVMGDQNSFSEIIDEIKKISPDGILVTSYMPQCSLILKSIRDAGIDSTVIGGDSWTEKMFVYFKSYKGENYFLSNWSRYLGDKKSIQFSKKYRERFGLAFLNEGGPLSYDSVYLFAAAAAKAGKFDSDAVSRAMAEIKNFNGVTGRIEFDKDRNPRKPVILNKIEGDKLTSEFFE